MIEAVADNDINDKMLVQLEARVGHRIPRIRQFGMSETPDVEVLHWAASAGFVVISHDAATMIAVANARIARGLTMPGLIIVRQSSPIGRTIEYLYEALEGGDPADFVDQVKYGPK